MTGKNRLPRTLPCTDHFSNYLHSKVAVPSSVRHINGTHWPLTAVQAASECRLEHNRAPLSSHQGAASPAGEADTETSLCSDLTRKVDSDSEAGGGKTLCKGQGVIYIIPALPKLFPIAAQLPVSHPEEYRPWKHITIGLKLQWRKR